MSDRIYTPTPRRSRSRSPEPEPRRRSRSRSRSPRREPESESKEEKVVVLTAPTKIVRKTTHVYNQDIGRVYITPNSWVDINRGFQGTNRRLYDVLDKLEYEQHTVRLFGKEHKVPRLQAAFGDVAYKYSGSTVTVKPWSEAPEYLVLFKEITEERLGVKFNFALINQYVDGDHGVGWHQDNEPGIVKGSLIASYSLGEERRFLVRLKNKTPDRVTYQFPAGNDVLLVMAGSQFQFECEHSVPKTKAKIGKRFNITFRVMEQEEK